MSRLTEYIESRGGDPAEIIADAKRDELPFTACPWLVWVPTGNPEPDQEYGLGGVYAAAECGADVEWFEDGWRCEAGHEHLTYGSPAQVARERIESMIEERL